MVFGMPASRRLFSPGIAWQAALQLAGSFLWWGWVGVLETHLSGASALSRCFSFLPLKKSSESTPLSDVAKFSAFLRAAST